MIFPHQIDKILKRALPSYAIIITTYIGLIFILPASSVAMETYNLSALNYKLTLFVVSIPLLFVWFAAFLGYDRLFAYARAVKSTPEGEHFDKLAYGVAWLAWSLPIPSIIILLLGAISDQWGHLYSTSVVAANYVALVIPLIAFLLIGTAAHNIFNQARLKLSATSMRLIMIIFALAGMSYCWLILRHFDLDSLTASANPYRLPLWLMLTTVVVPHLYMWFIGLLAAYEISQYSKTLSGHIYRRAMLLLVSGLVIVIAGSIALQYLNIVQPRANHLVLNLRLALTLIFRIAQGCGFALIAWGAMRLKRIEEV